MSQYKRLNLFEPKDDDQYRHKRMHRGLEIELDTQKFTVPYSLEGSNLWSYIDRKDVFSVVKSRVDLLRIVKARYPDFKVLTFDSELIGLQGIRLKARIQYRPTGDLILASNNIGV